MKIIFLIPPSEYSQSKIPVDRVYGCNYGYDYKPAIHLLLLATITKRLGHEVRFLDCPAEGFNAKRFLGYIRNTPIDIVVFFTVWLSMDADKLAAKIISDAIPKVKIVFVGTYPTWKPELFIKDENYFAIRGEPEKSSKDFLNCIRLEQNNLSKIQSLSFLKDGMIIHNPYGELIDINTIPMPNRRLLKGNYFFNRIDVCPATVMCVSRGCSYSCNYCAPNALDQTIELEYSNYNLGKPPLRLKNVKDTVEEFEEIASLGYRGIEICDNQFVWDKERTIKICEAIRPLKLKWICYARADHLKDKDALKSMKEAGCALIYIGTESFNQKILDDIKKDINLKDNYKAVKLVRECGIEPEISVLLGASGLETKQTIFHNIKEARKIKSRFIHYSIASPLPNTRLYKISKEKGWIKNEDFVPLDNVRGAQLNLPYVKAEKLQSILKRCYFAQYLSACFIIKQILHPTPLSLWKYRLKALFRFLRYIR